MIHEEEPTAAETEAAEEGRKSSKSRSSRAGRRRKEEGGGESPPLPTEDDDDEAANKSKQLQQQSQRRMAIGIVIGLVLLYLFMRTGSGEETQRKVASNSDLDSDSDSEGDDAYGGGGEEEGKRKEKEKEKEKKKKEEKPKDKPKVLPPAPTFAAEKIVVVAEAGPFIMAPFKLMNNMAICPNVGGGGKNAFCTKGFVEFRFKVGKPGMYYLYVETFAPTLLDNSLWVSPPLDPINGNELDKDDEQLKSFLQCDSKHTAGTLVPHKHVVSKKIECCPKYLAKNAKKNMGAFYSECCYTSVGPYLDGIGCVMDLEMDTEKPLWNLSPRGYLVKDPSKLLVIRLYGREDGTGVTRAMLSTNDKIKDFK